MGRIPGHREEECIRLFEKVLGAKALRRHTFSFLRGDPTPKRPQGSTLPVDAYFPEVNLVVEYMGPQHFEANPFMDRRPGRAAQRRRHQERRTVVLGDHGIVLIRVRYDEPLTEEMVRTKLIEADLAEKA